MIVTDTFLLFTALIKFAPQDLAGPGISRSSPPLAFSIVSLAAPQSLTTYPSKPHSSFKTSIRRFS